MIKVDDQIPEMTVQIVKKAKQEMVTTKISTSELFHGKILLFGLPGAFTPTCSQKQLPSFAEKEAELRNKGYQKIICMAVNDFYVMQAWKEQVAPNADIIMLADGSAAFAKALGLELDCGELFGIRCQRFLMAIENGKVTLFNLEENPSTCTVSSAEAVL